MKIEIINVQSSSKPAKNGTYTQLDVAFKNLTFGGKVEGKKIMSFTNKEVFATQQKATTGQVYEVTVEKEGQYNQWTKISLDGGTSTGLMTDGIPKANTSPKSTYETPEERANRQRMIVRQSSLSNAIDTLSVNPGKDKLRIEDVLQVAGTYFDWVMEKEIIIDISNVGLPEDDDIPM